MRCIEIPLYENKNDYKRQINRNMRCIEMPGNAGKSEQEYRLIET